MSQPSSSHSLDSGVRVFVVMGGAFICARWWAHMTLCVCRHRHMSQQMLHGASAASPVLQLPLTFRDESKIPLARSSRMEHLPGRLRSFCLTVKLPVPRIFEPAVFAQWREELVGMTPVGERQMSVCHMRGEDGEWGESANEVEGADSWACK